MSRCDRYKIGESAKYKKPAKITQLDSKNAKNMLTYWIHLIFLTDYWVDK